jgi:hypothetical protein
MRCCLVLMAVLCAVTSAAAEVGQAPANSLTGISGPAAANPAVAWQPGAPPPVLAADQTFPVPVTTFDPAVVPPLALDAAAPPAAALLTADTIYRNRAWRVELGFIPTRAFIADGLIQDWPDNGFAMRLSAGYESASGFGGRFRMWTYGRRANTNIGRVDLIADTISIDLYKRFFLESTEVVVGGGLMSAAMNFQLANGDQSDFPGTGASTFVELWHPFYRRAKLDIGFTARGRIGVAPGHWTDDTGFIVPPTSHDTITVIETAWGIEMRRRFGVLQDKYWYLAFLLDYESLESPWLTVFTGTSASFQGANITWGLAW